MKLHEFQTKAILRREGIPLPDSILSSSPTQAVQAASEIGYPVILKAQSLVSGRGKAGGIRLSRNDDETEKAASDILNIKLKNISIQHVLVEKAINIEEELFIGVHYKAGTGSPTFILSTEGGISLEDNKPLSPVFSFIHTIDPLLGIHAHIARQGCVKLRIDPKKWKVIEQISIKLWSVFEKYDATLAEINSMVFDKNGHPTVLDGKLIIDNNALFRQREFAGFLDPAITSFAQAEARKFEHELVRMDGNLAVLSNGQGLASATIDEMSRLGLYPASVLLLDNNATPASVSAACRLLENDPSVKAVLVNIYCNYSTCSDIVQGIINGQEKYIFEKPYFIRLVGSQFDLAYALLTNYANVNISKDLIETVRYAASFFNQ